MPPSPALPSIDEQRGPDAVPDLYRAQLEASGLGGLGDLGCWTVTGTNRQNAYATHGLFRYYGKYPPPIGRRLLTDHTVPGDLVIDPMCGSGTTGVEATLLGRRALQFDVNPVSVAVALAKTTHVPLAVGTEALQTVLRGAEPTDEETYPLRPDGLRDPEHWFLQTTADSLRGLHRAIRALAPGAARDLMQVCFLGTVRRASRATTQQGRLFLDAATALDDVLPTFERNARRAIRAVAELPPDRTVPTALHDAQQPLPVTEPAALCILHPPYFNSYKYSRINSLELSWTDTTPADVRRQEVREFFKIGKRSNAAHYVADMAKVVSSAAQTVRPGGVLALMIGDTRLQSVHVPVTRDLVDRVHEEGLLRIEQVNLRIPKHTEATWVASQRRKKGDLGAHLCDYVLIFRRTPA